MSAAATSPASKSERLRQRRLGRPAPGPSSRPRTISTSASSRVQSAARRHRASAISGSSLASGHSARNCGRRSAATHSVAPGAAAVPRVCRAPARPANRSSPAAPPPSSVRNPSQTSASCSSSALSASGQASLAHPRDRFGIEPAELGRVLRREPAPAHHRLGAPFLQRRIVEIGVGPRRQHLSASGEGCVRSRAIDADRRRTSMPAQQPFQPFDIHRLGQAVVDGLVDQRMIGNLALADQVLGAGDLVREHRARSGPRPPCARVAAAPSCRRGTAAARARRWRPSASASANIGASSSAWISSSRTLAECR